MIFVPKTKWFRDMSFWTAAGIICIILADPLISGFPMGVLSWDTFGYYLYLPQAFIEEDITLRNQEHIQSIFDTYHPSTFKYQFHPLENGNYVIQYSSGVAILVLPFFLLGHFFAWIFNFPMDGFSTPYVIAFLAANYFYMVLGVILLRKVLLKFFSIKLTAILLIIVCIGTNFFTINIANPGLSHIFLFPLYCAVILYTVKWYDTFNTKSILIIAAMISLIVLVRPLDGLIVLFPLLYNIHDLDSFKKRCRLLYEKRKDLLIALTLATLICSIQLIYWKYVSGHFLINSYRNPEEGLYLDDPNLFRFLFSYRNGWLVYTPIMFFLVFGFVFRNEDSRKWLIPVGLFTVLLVYCSCCWSTWWYGHSFGQRTMIQTYPLLALPFGAFIIWIRKKKWRLILLSPILTFLVILSVFQSYQFKRTVIHGSRMTKEYYWAVFGKMNVSAETRELMLVDRDNPVFSESDFRVFKEFKLSSSSRKGITLNHDQEFSEVLDFAFEESTDQYYAWYKIEADMKIHQGSDPEMVLITARFFRRSRPYAASYSGMSSQENYINNEWFHATIMYITPCIRASSDRFETMIWNRGQKVTFKNLKVTSYVKIE